MSPTVKLRRSEVHDARAARADGSVVQGHASSVTLAAVDSYGYRVAGSGFVECYSAHFDAYVSAPNHEAHPCTSGDHGGRRDDTDPQCLAGANGSPKHPAQL